MTASISDLRKEYTRQGLDLSDVLPDPVAQFRRWFDAALQAGVAEPNAMHLCTVGANGRPDGRIVLLKDVSDAGFVFYTNYESRKSRDMLANPFACLTFFYPDLEQQIRVEGRVEKVSEAESDAYFGSRPRGSQIGAWVSPQSQPIDGRDVLTDRQQQYETQFADQPVPRPPHWGGFRVVPDLIEFWQGRPSRLHDRVRYQRADTSTANWQLDRLAP
ncbi:pyridoxamine 5'-phosphate oxidase [Spirosoma rhododendri]|uniref:Pyridoxine/pyridoxamine 5'-phosphate oxidase n=1 Tax=Spirosoma rhododendri TaxID=2728024 RepID=A0A7L5DSS0_9BACT|nr:pyridoxamine 5'-phosphate oxidase [Spirosoma rhododendri]QJD79628.1 pyridoxamine 5'-phosphate oxidase [Spirosoma rhododendri]